MATGKSAHHAKGSELCATRNARNVGGWAGSLREPEMNYSMKVRVMCRPALVRAGIIIGTHPLPAVQATRVVRLSCVGLHRAAIHLMWRCGALVFLPQKTLARRRTTHPALFAPGSRLPHQQSTRLDPDHKEDAWRSATIEPTTPRPSRYLNRFTLVCASTGAKSLQLQFGWLHGATRSFPDQW